MSPRCPRRLPGPRRLPALGVAVVLTLVGVSGCSGSDSGGPSTTRRPASTDPSTTVAGADGAPGGDASVEGGHAGTHKYGSSMDPTTVGVEQVAELGPGPSVGDHWKVVTGLNVCGRFIDVAPVLPQPSKGLTVDPLGRLSIAPAAGDPTGHQVTVADLLALWGMSASTGSMTMPANLSSPSIRLATGTLQLAGRTFRTGDKCIDSPGEVQLWYYTPEAVKSGNPIRVVVTDPEKTPIVADGSAIVLTFSPESSLPTLPPSALLD